MRKRCKMRKHKKVFPLICLFIGVFILGGCKYISAQPMTVETFNAGMGELGYEIFDATEHFEEEPIEQCSFAKKDDLIIEFYQFHDADAAYNFFAHNEELVESWSDVKKMQTSVNVNQLNRYSVTTRGQYFLFSRIEDTMIYVATSEDKKGEVKDAIDFLNEQDPTL